MKTLRTPYAILREDYALVRKWRANVEGWPDEALLAEDVRVDRSLRGEDPHGLALRRITYAQLAEPIRRHIASHGAPDCMARADEQRSRP